MTLLIKICGLSTPETVEAALDAGADMIGFVFHPKSPRFVTPDQAARLAAPARGQAGIVGLIVNQTPAAAADIAAVLKPDWLQLHGSETPDTIRATASATGCRILKAFGVANSADLAAVTATPGAADLTLIDAKPPADAAYPGGHGQAFDWTLLRTLDPGLKFMLSGGLTPDTVAGAIATLRGYGIGLSGIDVSSGVESAPGVKDISRIRAFVAAARKAEHQS